MIKPPKVWIISFCSVLLPPATPLAACSTAPAAAAAAAVVFAGNE